jgi:hypothetical protein
VVSASITPASKRGIFLSPNSVRLAVAAISVIAGVTLLLVSSTGHTGSSIASVAPTLRPPTATPTPTPIVRRWQGPNREVEIGFGISNAIKVKVLDVTRTNDLGLVSNQLDVDHNSELLIVRLEYKSTQGKDGHRVTQAKDFALRASGGDVAPIADDLLRVGTLLNGNVPDGKSLTGNIVFLVDASDSVSSLIYTATRERKQLDISDGGGPIRQARATLTRTITLTPTQSATPTATATTDPAVLTERATQAAEHMDAADEYRRANQLGLALVELQQALALDPESEIASSRLEIVAAEATATVEVAVAQATAVAEAAIAQARAAAEREAQAQATATARVRQSVQATVTAYRQSPPRGTWRADAAGIAVAAGDITYDAQIGIFRPAAGHRFVSTGVGVRNDRLTSHDVNPYSFSLVDQSGRTYAISPATFNCNPTLQAVTIQPDNRTFGCIVFEIPTSIGPAKIVYRSGALFAGAITIDLERAPDVR